MIFGGTLSRSSAAGTPAAHSQGIAVSDNKLPGFHDNDRNMRAIGTAASLGFSLVTSLVVLIGGGIWLDQWRDTSPVFTLIGVALGLVAAGYQLYELALLGRPDRVNGPMGRALQRRASERNRHH